MTKATQIDKIIGGNIYALRQMKGWSRTTLAKQMGLTQQQVGKYEKAESCTTPSKLIALAKIFDCSISYFYNEKSSKTPSNKTSRGWKMMKKFDSLSKDKQDILINILRELCKSDTSR